jgi:hypothetical protein
MTLASNAKTMDPAAATVVRRTVLRIAPLEVDSRFEEALPEGGKVHLGGIDPAWGESYAVSNAVADIASLWGPVGAADPGRYEEALKRARAAADRRGGDARPPLTGGSISFRKDECHVMHPLLRKIFNIPVHLGNIHTHSLDWGCIRFSRRSREESQLQAEPDQDNCNNSDTVMHAHEVLRLTERECQAASATQTKPKFEAIYAYRRQQTATS